MSFPVGVISVPITGDEKPLSRSLDNVHRKGTRASRDLEASFRRVGGTFQRVGGILTASVTAPLILGVRQAVRETALLEGAMAKFNVVFGDQAKEVEAWVGEFRKGVPLARREIIQAAASMQDLLIPMGVAREDASDMTKEWLELAAALAAFNDVPVSQALDAIRSGIAGQSRPLRDLGINASVAAVEQTALANGLMQAGEQMNDQVRQKALLIQAYSQSKDAVDGYEDQLGTTLMAEQELQASIKDTLAVFGQDLQPAYNDLISTLGNAVRWIGELDETQRRNIIQAGKWALALGPGLTALGTLIRLAPLATKGIVALTAAMKANPYMAAGAALIALGTHIWLVNKRARELNDTITNVLSGDIESQTLDQINDLIVEMEKRLDKMRSQAKSMGMDATEFDHFNEAVEELDKMIERRDELATRQIDKIISDKAKDETTQTADSAERLSNAVERLRISVQQPIDNIIDPLSIMDANEQAALLSDHLFEIMNMEPDTDFSHRFFPPGSLGELQERMQALRDEMQMAFDPEAQERIRQEMELTQAEMDKILGRTRELSEESRVWGEGLTSTLSQAVLHGRNFEDVLSNILKQLASRSFVQGISMLAGGGVTGGGSFLGAVFGGLFHSGGVVPGAGERTVQVRGGEGVFTQSQMKAMGSMRSGGVSINYDAMSRGFERALDRKLRKLSHGEIYAMAQKGRLDY